MRSNLLLRSAVSLAACLAAASFTGCSTVALDESGDMEAAYVAGSFQMLVNANAAATANATSEAFRQLGFFELKKQVKTYTAELVARTLQDQKVTVTAQEINSRQSTLSIRVNVAGDKNLSRKLFFQIEKNLGGASASTSGGL